MQQQIDNLNARLTRVEKTMYITIGIAIGVVAKSPVAVFEYLMQ